VTDGLTRASVSRLKTAYSQPLVQPIICGDCSPRRNSRRCIRIASRRVGQRNCHGYGRRAVGACLSAAARRWRCRIATVCDASRAIAARLSRSYCGHPTWPTTNARQKKTPGKKLPGNIFRPPRCDPTGREKGTGLPNSRGPCWSTGHPPSYARYPAYDRNRCRATRLSAYFPCQ
jgi:hypothetical protein